MAKTTSTTIIPDNQFDSNIGTTSVTVDGVETYSTSLMMDGSADAEVVYSDIILKDVADIALGIDVPFITLAKVLSDTTSPDDVLTTDVTKGLYEDVGTSDYGRGSFIKVLRDATEGFTDRLVFDAELVKRDEAIPSESLSFDATIRKYDVFDSTDFTAIGFTKYIFDFVTTSDELNSTLTGKRRPTDSSLAADDLLLSPSLFKTDEVNDLQDSNILNFNKNVANEVISAEEIRNITVSKILQDSATVRDLVSIPDGITFSFHSTEFSSVDSISDSFNKVVGYVRAFTDQNITADVLTFDNIKRLKEYVGIFDRPQLSSLKSVNETASADQYFEKDVALFKTDSIEDISEASVILLGKNLFDSFNSSDDSTLQINLFKSDSVTALDLFEFGRFMTEAESSSPDDSYASSLTKPFADTYDSSDESVLLANKNLEDVIITNDQKLDFNLTKRFYDIVFVGDLALVPDGLTYQANKAVETNISLATDNFARVVEYNREFADTYSSSDNSTLGVTLGKLESSTALEQLTFDFTKSLDDTATVVTTTTIDMSKPLADSVNSLSDDDTIQFGKFAADEINAIFDVDTFSLRKGLFDASTANQRIELETTKRLADQFASTDLTVLDTTKSLADTYTTTDAQTLDAEKFLADTLTVGDLSPTFDVIKVLRDVANVDDLVTVPDGSTYTLNKTVPLDTASSSDVFSYLLSTLRKFFESITQSDEQTITFTKNLFDSVTVLDTILVQPIYPNSDSINVNESVSLGIEKDTIQESNLILDNNVLVLNKALNESLVSQDDQTFDVGKNLSESEVASDANVLDVSKPFDESLTVDQFVSLSTILPQTESLNVLSIANIDYTKPLTESQVVSDTIFELSYSKNIFDSVTAQDLIGVTDGSTFTFGDFESDSTSSSDNFAKVVNFVRNVNEELTTTDSNVFSVDKYLDEYLLAFEANVLNVGKALSDSSTTSDFSPITFEKGVIADSVSSAQLISLNTFKTATETVTGSDFVERFEFGKNLTESLTFSDSVFEFDITKFLSDSVTAEDLANIFDGSQYSLSKTVADSSTASDLFDKVLQFNRAFDDTANSSEDLIFTADLFKTDTASTSDSQQFNVEKLLTDQAASTEDLVFDLDKLLTDSYSTSDDDTIQFGKFAQDTSTTSDDQSFDVTKLLSDVYSAQQNILLNVTLREVDTFGTSDDDTIQFGKNVFESVSFSDTQSFDVSKLLIDSVSAQDLIGVTDGSTFTFGDFESDSYSVSDLFDRLVNYNRLFQDSSLTSDALFEVDFTKVLQEAALATETLSFAIDKELSDSASSNENLALTFNKFATDSYDVDDSDTITFTKGLFDQQSVADLLRTIDVTKLLTDTATTSINLEFAVDKVLIDSYSSSESASLTSTKPIYDAVTASELIDIVRGKFFADAANSSEDLSFSLSKVLFDSVSAQDLIGVTDGSTFTFGDFEKDSSTTSDLFTRVVSYQRLLADSSGAADVLVSSFTKALEENVVGTDDLSFDVDKQLQDSFNSSEQAFLSPTKNLDDLYFSLDDSVLYFNKANADSANTSDTITQKDVDKLLSDIASTSEDLVFDVSKLLADSFSSGDQTFLLPTKNFADSYSSSDDSTLFTNKGLQDSVSEDEDLIYSLSKILTDSVSATDLIGVTDGSTFTFGDFESDSSTTSDNFAKVLQYIRAFDDEALPSEDTRFDISLVKFDSTGADDNLVFNLDKELYDSYVAADAPAITLDKSAIQISASTQDDDTIQFGKALADDNVTPSEDITKIDTDKVLKDTFSSTDDDTFALDKLLEDQYTSSDDSVIEFDKFASDTTGTNDDETLSVVKGLSDASTSSESIRKFDITKLLTDVAQAVDLAGITDGSTFTFNDFESDFSSSSDFFARQVDYSRIFADQIQSISDDDTIQFGKFAQDTSSANDDQAFDITKLLTDAGDANENLIYSFTKRLNDNSQPLETAFLEFDKYIDDSVGNIVDFASYSAAKTIVDDVATNASGTLINQNYVQDHTYFAEDYVGETRAI